MKKLFNPIVLHLFTLIAGVVGFGLRLWLFLIGRDERGLLPEGHIAGILALIFGGLVIAAMIAWVFANRSLTPIGSYAKLFPNRILPGIGCLLAAAGVIYSCIWDVLNRPQRMLLANNIILIVTLAFGLLAVVSLVLLSISRFRGQHPTFWLQAAVTIFFMVSLISRYLVWSKESQIQVYLFPLLASVCLMLSAYHGAVLDANKRTNRRLFIFFNRVGFVFCLMSLQAPFWPFYLGMAAWLGTGLCSLKPGKPQQTESEAT